MTTLITATKAINNLLDAFLTEPIGDQHSPEDVIAICTDRYQQALGTVNNPSNNPLMLLLREKEKLPIYFVYQYLDIDGVVVYVGNGLKCRPYDFIERRKHTLALWLLEKQLSGHDPVEIVLKEVTKAEAAKVEERMIREFRPRFNIQHNR